MSRGAGRGFGVSPIGVNLWKLLDGEHTIDGLLEEIHSAAEGVPEDAGDHIRAFIEALVAEGLAGFDSAKFAPGAGPKKSSPLQLEL